MINRTYKKVLGLLLLLLFTNISAEAETFWVDPVHGKMSNNGSKQSPWSRLDSVFLTNKLAAPSKPNAPISSNDTIMLYSGFHGRVNIVGSDISKNITILAAKNSYPQLSLINLKNCSGWYIKGLNFSPTFNNDINKNFFIYFQTDTYRCTADSCFGFSIDNSSDWDSTAWNSKAWDGIFLRGIGDAAKRCSLKNVNFGIQSTADSCIVEYNRVENFIGDGMRGLGDYSVFQYNYISGCIAVNGNHDDGFQSWSLANGEVGKDTVHGVIIRGNKIIIYLNEKSPLTGGNLQGIGCFDGFYKDFLIENNVICSETWHGISLYGAINCKIINNTVVSRNPADKTGPPWIAINPHKNGSLSHGNIIRNNITTSLQIKQSSGEVDHNIVLKNNLDEFNTYFVNYGNLDFHLQSGCKAIDYGSSDSAPEIDIEGEKRADGAIDAGAYQYKRDISGLDNESTNDLFISPNPVTDFVTVHPGQKYGAIEIYSAFGSKIIETEWKEKIDMSGLLTGWYYVKVGDKIFKIVKI